MVDVLCKCGVRAIGRCKWCQEGFCVSHTVLDQNGAPESLHPECTAAYKEGQRGEAEARYRIADDLRARQLEALRQGALGSSLPRTSVWQIVGSGSNEARWVQRASLLLLDPGEKYLNSDRPARKGLGVDESGFWWIVHPDRDVSASYSRPATARERRAAKRGERYGASEADRRIFARMSDFTNFRAGYKARRRDGLIDDRLAGCPSPGVCAEPAGAVWFPDTGSMEAAMRFADRAGIQYPTI